MTRSKDGYTNGSNGFGALSRLSSQGTLRLKPELAWEMEVQTLVRTASGAEPAAKKGIIEEALEAWFKKNPIPKKEREAAELLLRSQFGG